MGWALSWVAVRGMSAEELRRRLGLRPTGRTTDVPGRKLSATTAGEDWAVVCARRYDRFLDGALLGPLSASAEVVGCVVEEDARFSQAFCWKDGAHLWSVTHDAERSLDHLQATGDLPAEFQDLEARALAARQEWPDGPDYLFDVPLELARAVVGFRHDAVERAFEELEPLEVAAAPPPPPAEPGLLGAVSRWFRGR
jgi:hypothetical protein